MRPGEEVEVQSRFEGSWVRGFEVAEIDTDQSAPSVLIRRRSDGEVRADAVPAQRRARELTRHSLDRAERLTRPLHRLY